MFFLYCNESANSMLTAVNSFLRYIFQNSFTTLVRRTSFTREILHADETLMQVPKGIRKTVVSCPV